MQVLLGDESDHRNCCIGYFPPHRHFHIDRLLDEAQVDPCATATALAVADNRQGVTLDERV